MYELRSYHLKPGTMVEWSNYWAKAIKLRDYQHTEAYMGLFSQIGELYNVKVLVFNVMHPEKLLYSSLFWVEIYPIRKFKSIFWEYWTFPRGQ